MKRGNLLLLYFLVIVAVTTLSFFVWQAAADKNHKISGYAWSENIGWVSLNCYNEGINDKCAQTDYGLDFNKKTKEFFGWAWSEYGGWLCFGKTCADSSPTGEPSQVKITDHGLVYGWAKWINVQDSGWVSLQGEPIDSAGLSKVACKNCYKLKGDTTDNCELCFTDEENGVGIGGICESCSECEDNQCVSCSSCFSYGVGVDFSSNSLVGWAWGSDQAEKNYGWLSFNPSNTKSLVHYPYFQTVGGDVYSNQGLGSSQQGSLPEGKYSATYMLQSNGDIIHYDSECQETGQCEGVDGWVSNEIGQLDFPNKENDYLSEFGPIDVKGLLAGQYGDVVNIVNSSQISSSLRGLVYYSSDTLVINSPKVFSVGQGEVSGAGTVVVRGDLYLNSNLFYQSGTMLKSRNLPSLGFIVLKKNDGSGGSVYIDPSVQSLVGNIYAENEIQTGSYNADLNDPTLTIFGLLVAKKFKFEREYVDLSDEIPSEKIIYDGRIIANSPPGFTQLSAALPVWVK